jgi:adenylate kinase
MLLLGAPGSGKGTQGVRLAEHFGVRHMAAGDLLRDEVARGTELGKAAQEHMSRGDFVPDDLVIEMVLPKMVEAAAAGGYVLDGFPRNISQAQTARGRAKELGAASQAAIYLVAPDDELTRRLLARGATGARRDDTEEIIRHRLELFHEKTQPMIEYYRQRDLLLEVDADAPIDEVTQSILKRLAAHAEVADAR